MPVQADVAILGGGLHGLSCALQLARQGAEVVVLERDWIGRHASTANAGGVRTLNRDRQELDLGLAALALWPSLPEILDEDCGFRPVGQVRIARTETDFATETARVQALQSDGYTHEEMINANDLKALLPQLGPECAGASYARNDGAADPHLTLRAFRRAAERAGARMMEGVTVTQLSRHNTYWDLDGIAHTPNIVIAAGAWSGSLARSLGDELPSGVRASMMTVTERTSPFPGPVVGCVGAALSLKQTTAGTLVIGGGVQGKADLTTGRSQVDFQRLATGLRLPLHLFPCLEHVRITRCWTGIEALTPDHLPVIGPSPRREGVFYCYGFSGHGFELAPITGFVLADLIAGNQPRWSLKALCPSRF
ncbi:sarcosine oxidase subunit beta [Gluconobacter japonicus]|nr:sarcosine oxidase subunit beta [Gluconobacter japonicus]